MNKSNNHILFNSMEENIRLLQEIFKNDETLQIRRIQNIYNNIKCSIIYIDGMVDTTIINDNIIKPILGTKIIIDEINFMNHLKSYILTSGSVEKSMDLLVIIRNMIAGDTIVFIDGSSSALIIATKGIKSRAIEEPSSERVIKGPKEGFNESLTTNLSLIRKRIQTKDLKFHFMELGERTNTKTCVCYIEGLAKDEKINEVIDKIGNISIDGVLDVKYIQEFIDDNPFSIFETYSNTEKPDVVAGRILEGRLAILVDGSPVALTLPAFFIEDLMASDDYYLNYYFATIGRILRTIGFIASISIPALYLSLLSFHQELIPTPLLVSIYTARQGVPFPTFLELFVLLAVFEGLREAGTRVPGSIGESISIVGALVLGSAAVDARFVSAPMIIIVGMTAITGLSIPALASAVVIIRAFLLVLSSMLGIYGYIFGMLAVTIHLFSLRSLGVPFMGDTSLNMQSQKDKMIRAPWWYMRYRPKFISKNPKRGTIGGKGDE